MTEPKSVIEYGKRCLLCRNDSAASRVLCWKHCDEIRDMLDVDNRGYPLDDIPPSIPVLYHTLDVLPGASGMGERRAPGFESMPPGSVHNMAMRDSRTMPAEDDPVRSVAGTLAQIIAAVCDELIYTWRGLGTSVDAMCRWLYDRLEPLMRLPWADDLYRDLRDLRDSLRAAHGDPLPRALGTCTRTLVVSVTDNGDHHNAVCGHPIYPPQDRNATVVTCARCHAKYDGIEQLRLRLGGDA